VRRMGIPFNACLPITIGSDRLWVVSCMEGRTVRLR
jgi:hypothetical protein